MEDRGASIIAKLKNKSKESGKPLQVHMQLFYQEEFLRRVSLSKYSDSLVLKGGLFIYTLTNFESRSTIDVDFLLRQFSNNIEDIECMVKEIIAIDTGNDFISFESKGFVEISPQRKYHGISFQLIGRIKNTRTPFNIDIGIGDVIIPKAEKRKIPVQLAEFTSPEISTYSLESTISEKFDAILQRLEMTSRMKDFYDIWYLANTFNFDGRTLQEAVEQTLSNRATAFEKDSLDYIASFSADKDMQLKWRQFLTHTKLQLIDFDVVLNTIQVFIAPVWQAIVNEDECLKIWSAKDCHWQ
jgi:predicted nucleotidyltransferase component of viral defense system